MRDPDRAAFGRRRRNSAPRPLLAPALALIVSALALFAWVGTVDAALPRAVARAFLDAGVPVNAVSIVVQETAAPRPLFAHQPDKAMNPASVMKLVTTFAALELLGPDYRWKTEAYLDGALTDGVLQGNLILKGYGDPKITLEQWQGFMLALHDKGLDAVTGDLVLDRSFFAPAPHNAASFDGEPLKPYNVGPDALLVNFKSVKFTFAPSATGDAMDLAVEPSLDAVHLNTVPHLAPGECGDWRSTVAASFIDRSTSADVGFSGRYPAVCGEREWWLSLLDHPSYVHGMFETYFRATGGRFTGRWRSGVAPKGVAPFAVLESPPLYDVVRDVNKLSNNLMARQVFLTLATVGTPPPATTARATAKVQLWLAGRKLRMPELVLDNGSGLSRTERISAGSLSRLLLAADASPVRDEFASSLAVAATDGTVQRRFQNGTVAGQALLKTGTLEGVRAIAGYVIDAEGRRWTVVALVNHATASRAQPALDYLVQWVYREGARWRESDSH